MTEQSGKPSDDAASPDVADEESLSSQLLDMVSAFWSSRQRNALMLLAAALVTVVSATAYMQIRLNAWNQPFYDSLAHKNLTEFVAQLGVFAELAVILLVLNVAQMWLNQTSKVTLREGLVLDLLNQWLSPSRAFRLSNSGTMGANPDQRIHEDARHLTELTTDLGIGLLQSTLLLICFIDVLWVLSRQMVLSFGGHVFNPPGYMVWCALFYAGTASFLSWRVGRPLISLNAEHYAREAELRFALVRVNEEIDGVTLYGGEADEKTRLQIIFDTVLAVSRRIVGATTRLTWVTSGYGWFTIAAPILVAAPAYFQSDMSFGELMMVVGAFNQVQQALRWFVDNFSSIADWRATLLRVASFRKTILTMDKLGRTTSRIDFAEAPDSSIHIDDLQVATLSGCIKLSEPHVELKPGEHVLITGENGAEKTLLFRAIAGLWPWGSGRITHPARQTIMFLPARPYIPPGTLRSAVTYPHPVETNDDAAITKAFAAVGLEHLEPQLDKVDRWDRQLNDNEKQCIAFARVILQKPKWVVLDDALDLLDPASRPRIEAIFTAELADVGVIDLGQDVGAESFFTRKLRLMADPSGPTITAADQGVSRDQSTPARETLPAE